ncbi:macrophage mannose receptor 1-like [Odontesthes bonariensis]|uniref:macrophage mannose receptor 1-like n=1 Tax=Odontesthes bonariensis TaxID=219752 RepID=UPI003F58AE1C
MTWSEAQAFCRKHEADLATFDNPEDHIWLMESIGDANVEFIWIGLTRSATEQWVWSEGIGVDKLYDFSTSKVDGDCIFMGPSGYWNVDDCSTQRVYVCEEYDDHGEERYILFNQSLTWRDAQSFCRLHYKDLVTVTTRAEHSQIYKLGQDHQQDKFWIGLFRDTWKWSDGSTGSFRNWYISEPNNNTSQNCVVTSKEFQHQWADEVCERRYPFVCNPKPKKKSFVVKVRISSDVNLNHLPAARDSLLQQFQSQLEKQGVTGVKVSWRAGKNEPVFQCQKDKEDGSEETGSCKEPN